MTNSAKHSPNWKRITQLTLGWILALLITLFIINSVWTEADKFLRILVLGLSDIVWLVFAWFLLSIPRGLLMKVMSENLGVKLDFVDWYGLSMVTNMLALIMPARSDFLVSSAYLKRKYGFPITRYASMVYGNVILLAFVLSLEAIVGLIGISLVQGINNLTMWIVVSGLLIFAIVLVFLPSKWLTNEIWIISKLRAVLEGWESLRSRPGLLLKLGGLIVFSSIVFSFWMYISYTVLDFQVTLLPLFLAAITTQMSFFVTLTPGNLGIRETLVGFISEATGLGFAEGVAITLLQRAISSVSFTLVGGSFALFLMPGIFNSKSQEPINNTPNE